VRGNEIKHHQKKRHQKRQRDELYYTTFRHKLTTDNNQVLPACQLSCLRPTMSDLQKQLDSKQKELNDLKASFDEYMSSSKELELELEKSLDEVCC
jgi:chromosome segregation ATPase